MLFSEPQSTTTGGIVVISASIPTNNESRKDKLEINKGSQEVAGVYL